MPRHAARSASDDSGAPLCPEPWQTRHGTTPRALPRRSRVPRPPQPVPVDLSREYSAWTSHESAPFRTASSTRSSRRCRAARRRRRSFFMRVDHASDGRHLDVWAESARDGRFPCTGAPQCDVWVRATPQEWRNSSNPTTRGQSNRWAETAPLPRSRSPTLRSSSSSKPGARRAASPVLALLSGAMALREQLPSVVDRGRAGAVLHRRRLREARAGSPRRDRLLGPGSPLTSCSA